MSELTSILHEDYNDAIYRRFFQKIFKYLIILFLFIKIKPKIQCRSGQAQPTEKIYERVSAQVLQNFSKYNQVRIKNSKNSEASQENIKINMRYLLLLFENIKSLPMKEYLISALKIFLFQQLSETSIRRFDPSSFL